MARLDVGEWIWRFIAIALLVAVGWMAWVISQINRPPVVLAAAFEAANKARVPEDARSGPRVEGVITAAPATPAPAASAPAEPAKDSPTSEPAKDTTPTTEAAKQTSAPEPAKQASTPEPAKAPEKPAAPSKTMEEEVAETVEAWAKAWSSKDVDGYLAAYASDFKVPGGETRAAWEKARRQRISAPKSIAVTVDALKIAKDGESRAKATFRQGYRSDMLEPRSVMKTLVLTRTEGRWLIQQETSGN